MTEKLSPKHPQCQKRRHRPVGEGPVLPGGGSTALRPRREECLPHRAFYAAENRRGQSAKKLEVEIEPEGAAELAKRSRGTPRLANRLLKRVRDFAQVKYDGVITKEVASFALDLLEVDRCGLDKNDRLILMTIIQKFGGGPVGLETLAAAVGEDSGTIEDVYEPYLVKNGFLNRTPKGRVATALAIEHFKQ